jgi:hypothetical protein
VIYLTLPELLHVAERTLDPDYAVRDYGLLEAALARPRATAFGKDAYPDLDAKAAALLHSIAAITPSSTATSDWRWPQSSPSTASTADASPSPTTPPTSW